MKPIIGVIPLFDEEKDSIWMVPGYLDSIREAGGIPIILPLKTGKEDLEQILELCGGFLLTGGQDVDPSLYRKERKATCGIACKERDIMEKQVLEYAIKEDKAILGICRGIQFLNACLGGTLYQDLSTEWKGSHPVEHHMAPPYDAPCHEVALIENEPLWQLLGKEKLQVNSYHHQAIKELAPALRVMAEAEDGLIEGVYMPDRKFVQGVQWHPEFSYQVDCDQLQIVGAFVNACK